MARQRIRDAGGTVQIGSTMRLWLLRIIVPLGGHREFVRESGFSNDALAIALGLGHWVDPIQFGSPGPASHLSKAAMAMLEAGEFDARLVNTELRQVHHQADARRTKTSLPACLQRNIKRLARLVGLSPADCRILEFAVMIHNERLLDDTADCLGYLSSVKAFHALSVILDLPEPDIRSSLSAQGVLARSGLVSVDRSGSNTLSGKLDLLSGAFADLMATAEADPVGLLRGIVSPAPAGELGLADYAHVRSSLDILLPYLRRAMATGRRGVNIYLHGAPGTGKSQLARTLARELACELFEVASENGDGDPVTGDSRLRAFRAAQCFFAQRQALMVFDEAEDVFSDGNTLFGSKSTAQLRKAWINRVLEENPVPTLWLSNSISSLDPAFVRRFDMVFELPVPPKRQREQILRQHCGDLLNDERIARVVEAEKLAPAVMARAASVVHAIKDELDPAAAADALERLISNTLEAQGHRPLIRHDPNQLPNVYDPGFISADVNLDAVATGLVRARAGRICLYGPPGTGKTAWCRWLAQALDVPLLVKRASDLMAPYVGENERNIAQAFREAEHEGALLLIDEVDTFLYDRGSAHRNWEVSLVNEMLAQMEAFAGVFIATTNRMEGLDQAALRRFDLKARFGFLRADQARELMRRYCVQLGFPVPPSALLETLARLDHLTPGDFVSVRRQHRFHPLESPAALVAALEAECMLKKGGQRPIGFV